MKYPDWLLVLGDQSFKGKCPSETIEQIDFMSALSLKYPKLRQLVVHPRNEGRRSHGQVAIQKKDGSINKGASDIIIPGAPTFVCELKKRYGGKWETGQLEYLEEAFFNGCFVCLALGADAAMIGVDMWYRRFYEGITEKFCAETKGDSPSHACEINAAYDGSCLI